MKSITPVSLSSALIAVSFSALANAQDAGSTQSPTVDALLECRVQTSDAERLACLDAQLSAFASAVDSGQLVIIERQSPETRNYKDLDLELFERLQCK